MSNKLMVYQTAIVTAHIIIVLPSSDTRAQIGILESCKGIDCTAVIKGQRGHCHCTYTRFCNIMIIKTDVRMCVCTCVSK